jgi:hypothetical protein
MAVKSNSSIHSLYTGSGIFSSKVPEYGNEKKDPVRFAIGSFEYFPGGRNGNAEFLIQAHGRFKGKAIR